MKDIFNILLFGIACLSVGIFLGKKEVHSQWEKESTLVKEKMQVLHQTYKNKEAAFQTELQAKEEIIYAQAEQSQKDIAAARKQLTHRMQQSENRANIYRNQANSEASEREKLANHAAELDRSITEGRLVVEELSTTLRQRDREVIFLGNQIKELRALYE